jgi:hypothetical protein
MRFHHVALIWAVATLLMVGVLLQACDGVGQAFSLDKDVTLPFDVANNHIYLKVKVGTSQPQWFVLDTGDKYALIDAQRANLLGLDLGGQIEVSGVGSQTTTASYVKNSFYSVVGLDGFTQPIVIALPLGDLVMHSGHGCSGIIGFDFLSKFVVEINYEKRTLTLHDRDRYQYRGSGESVPVTFDHGRPHIAARITQEGRPPIEGEFLLDIGDGGALTFNTPFVTQEHLLDQSRATEIRTVGYGVGGGFKAPVGRIKLLTFGRFAISDPVAVYSTAVGGAYASSVVQGSIGAEILRRFKVILDYDHGRVILEPNAHLVEPFEVDMSGLSLMVADAREKTLKVDEVYDHSPASAAGMRSGDILTGVDGRPISDLTLSDVRAMFRQVRTYNVTFRRGDRRMAVTLKLRRLI